MESTVAKDKIETPRPPQRLFPVENPDEYKNNPAKDPDGIKAMIFDMDGTVIDTTKKEYEAWKRAFSEYEIDFKYDEYIKVLGAKSAEIISMYINLSDSQMEKFVEKKEAYFREIVEKEGLAPIDNVESLLKKIKAIPLKMALASGSQKQKVDYIFTKVNFRQYFDVILTAEEVINGKPDPEVFLKTAEKLGVKPGEAIVWEDAENGVRAAKYGNLHCIAITTTNKQEDLILADMVINSYENLDIQSILKKFAEENYSK